MLVLIGQCTLQCINPCKFHGHHCGYVLRASKCEVQFQAFFIVIGGSLSLLQKSIRLNRVLLASSLPPSPLGNGERCGI